MSIQIEELKKNFGNKLLVKENLSKFSWFNLGGPAEIFFKPANYNELASLLKIYQDNKKINIIGAGSNTLIRDGGIEGVTIKLSTEFSFIKLLNDNIIEVGAATLDRKLSDFATKNSLSGFEFLSCIPGSIGGGIKMNSGCYGEEISKILVSLKAIDRKGKIKEIKRDEIKFSYRSCDLSDELIILSAKFKGDLKDKFNIEKKQLELIKRKKETQPSQVKTCGSTFKNPKDRKAWKLIKESGCEKISVGKAKISEKHCNFFINEGGATSNDIEQLIEKVKNQVLKKTGINLELEIKIIGIN
tara:strand:+ start:271 stop:1173 length:903 start_codon:yes stop_codon:yes gene_type:complete